MNGWKYKARTLDGSTRRGIIQAATWDEANRVLVARKLIPEQVRPAPVDQSFRLRRSPRRKALVIATRQFATLIRSGVPLVLTLEILDSLTEDSLLADTIDIVRKEVESGQSLANSLRNHPHVFSPIYVNMVEAGEQGGHLEEALARLADYMESAQQLRDRIRGAMIYPAVVLFVALVTFVIMLLYVVPTFEGLFAASGVELPLATALMVQASDFVVAHWLFILVGALAAILALRAFHDSGIGRRVMDALLLRVPVLGTLARKAAVARFTRTMASTLRSGVRLLDALPIAARSTDNAVLERAIIRTQSHIEQGQDVSRSLAATGVLPKLVARMVQVGEESGRLDEMFGKVADFFESEVQNEVEGLARALEPALVVVVGIVLGAMVITMYLPIFSMMSVGV